MLSQPASRPTLIKSRVPRSSKACARARTSLLPPPCMSHWRAMSNGFQSIHPSAVHCVRFPPLIAAVRRKKKFRSLPAAHHSTAGKAATAQCSKRTAQKMHASSVSFGSISRGERKKRERDRACADYRDGSFQRTHVPTSHARPRNHSPPFTLSSDGSRPGGR